MSKQKDRPRQTDDREKDKLTKRLDKQGRLVSKQKNKPRQTDYIEIDRQKTG
jgi:hypothetical protein